MNLNRKVSFHSLSKIYLSKFIPWIFMCLKAACSEVQITREEKVLH